MNYLSFLLIWALPILAIEWLIGGHYLWRERRLWPWVVLGLAAYFSLADAVAINAGIWSFDTHSLVGFWLGPVPIEEVLFYLLTAAMVVQGFIISWYGWTLRHAPIEQRRHWLVTLMRRRQAARTTRSDASPSPQEREAVRSPGV